MNVILILILLTTFYRTNRSYQYISIVLTAIGAYLMISNHASSADWLRSGLLNAGVICLLMTVPLLGITLYFEPYLEYLQDIMPRYVRTPFQFYTVTLLFANFLASLLNVGAIPFLYQLFAGVAGKYPSRLFYHAMARGMAPNLMWSPSYISTALVLQYMGLTWTELAPMGLFLAAIGLILALLLGRVELSCCPPSECKNPSIETESIDPSQMKYLYKLSAQMLLLIGFVLLLFFITHKSALVTVPLASLVAPFLLALILKRGTIFKSKFHDYFTIQLPKMYNQLILFSAIGFFGYGLGLSDRQFISDIIHHLGLVSPLTIIPVLMGLIVTTGILGIHPVISVSTIALSLSPEAIGLSQLQMAGALLTGYMVFTLLSPFSGTSMVFSAVTKKSTLDMSIKLNLAYGLLISLLSTLLLVWLM